MDAWDEGTSYDAYIGRWSRLVAHDFIEWLRVAPAQRWLDVGCGTGALSDAILRCTEPAAVLGIDRSPEYVAFATRDVLHDRVRFATGNADSISVDAESFDAVVSGLMLNFTSAPDACIAEMSRVTRSGGTIATYLWDYADGMQMLRYFWNAATDLFDDANALDEAARFPICNPDALTELFTTARLCDVSVTALDIPTRFDSFDDFWLPFNGGQGPAPAFLDSLNALERTQLRELIRRALPIADDGSISLIARAWAVRGRKP